MWPQLVGTNSHLRSSFLNQLDGKFACLTVLNLGLLICSSSQHLTECVDKWKQHWFLIHTSTLFVFSVTPATKDLVELCNLHSILMYVYCKPHKVKIEFSEYNVLKTDMNTLLAGCAIYLFVLQKVPQKWGTQQPLPLMGLTSIKSLRVFNSVWEFELTLVPSG